MTKSVRIENADNSHHKVSVRAEVLVDGKWVPSSEPPVALDYATALATLTIWSTKRLIIEEGVS